MTGQPFFSVLLLNRNGERFLSRCLEALSAQTYRDFELIVLDNASTDRSLEIVQTNYPGAQIVRFETNLGFAIANNRGAALARGEWLATLNNDAFPEPGWLSAMAQAIRANPEDTFFSSLIIQAQHPECVQSSGDVLNISGHAWSRDNHTPLNQACRDFGEVFSPCAAAAVYNRERFLAAGGFDESFVSHHEDIDLGFRLRLMGCRCLYVPAAVVAHIGSATYGAESDATVYQVQRNTVWCYFANMPGWLFWKYLPAHLLATIFFLAYYTLRGQAKPVWKAKLDAYRELPRALRQRKRVQTARPATVEQIERALDRQLLSPYLRGRRFSRRARN
ncbi:MAG: hypothetical protein B6D39_03215 [Anaerolineae bacterium UTCFX2]|nr:glycosyltransferase family 2 protein [Anaerolineae bacterium]MCZ7552281.1 glycosyltransferase family 2 protein [Anaerolineales bacterium]OQY93269.1 MAG: hypothetical protein B6D39_03215 [Anaerolineae bacterium UTCFX2]